jgi:hypothetical protein
MTLDVRRLGKPEYRAHGPDSSIPLSLEINLTCQENIVSHSILREILGCSNAYPHVVFPLPPCTMNMAMFALKMQDQCY